MDAQDLLLTTAELSVAFAGFSSLVGIFSLRRDDEMRLRVTNALRVMLDYSLLALFASLAPFLPMAAGASDAAVWQWSSGMWLVAGLLYAFFNRRWLRELYADPKPPRLVRYPVQVLDGLSILALLGNATGLFWEPSLLVYYAALLWFLAGAAFGFVGVVSSVWREPVA